MQNVITLNSAQFIAVVFVSGIAGFIIIFFAGLFALDKLVARSIKKKEGKK